MLHMADEKAPRERINDILQDQPQTLRSPLAEGVNIYDDGHFVAAFESIKRRRIQVVGEEVEIGEYLAGCGERNGNTRTYRKVFHLDIDTRSIEDVVLSHLMTQMAKFLPLDTLDMQEGDTERRVRKYTQRYRSGSSYSNESLYKFMIGTYSPPGRGTLKINVGGMIGAEFIAVADHLTPFWISYIRSITDVYPKVLKNSGNIRQHNMAELPKILSYTDWAKEQQLGFNAGIQAELRFLGYRATLRKFQRMNTREIED